jgi:MFS family permease
MSVRLDVVSMCMTTIPQNRIQAGHGRGSAEARIRHRLLPLYLSSWVLGITLWAPVEKLFLKHIGFTAGTVGLLAATYAGIVPFLEIPSGILADRWSRKGVLMIANAALGASALVGGLSTNVPMYLVSALLLGVYFAMHSGTVDSIVYDILLEETGTSDGFERFLGRLQVGESAALVVSAFAGAAIAQLWSPRITYFLTVPFVVVSIVVVARLHEPRIHRTQETTPVRDQLTTTFRTLVDAGQLRPIIVALVLTGVLLQMLVEFGPLWMVAVGAPAILFGPQWASLMSAQGLGGLLAGRMPLRQRTVTAAVVAMVAGGIALVVSTNPIVIIVAQVIVAVLLIAFSTVVMRMLHDQIPSVHRASVSSGVGTLSWIVFLPCSLAFGLVTQTTSIHVAACMVVAMVVLLGAALVRLARRQGEHSDNFTEQHRPTAVGGVPAVAAAGC